MPQEQTAEVTSGSSSGFAMAGGAFRRAASHGSPWAVVPTVCSWLVVIVMGSRG